MNIDTIITEKIQDQSAIAVNNVLLVKIKPIIRDLFEKMNGAEVSGFIDHFLCCHRASDPKPSLPGMPLTPPGRARLRAVPNRYPHDLRSDGATS